MITSKKLKISVVIPVYNEVESLNACIEALALQDDPLYEVIVVDNNSYDESKKVAKSFDFVTVVSERKQGVSYARNKGFNISSGDIIARIDADTIVPTDWTVQLHRIFQDKNIDAVSGSMHYYDSSFNDLADKIDLILRSSVNRSMSGQTFLQGCNIAVRKSAWKKVNDQLCHSKGLHEDVDLALHLQQEGLIVCFDSKLSFRVSSRRYDSDMQSFMNYVLALPRTYSLHGSYNYYPIYCLVALATFGYLPARSFNRLFAPMNKRVQANRIDPTSNVA